MVRIKNFLNPLKIRSKTSSEPEVDNLSILHENEDIYKKAYGELYNKNHKLVLSTLIFFMENDLYLRRKIANQNILTETPGVQFLQFAELQSYYNSFRHTLMADIVSHIVKSYNNVSKNISNFETASLWYNYAERVNEFYINALRNDLIQKGRQANFGDEHLSKMYSELIFAFEEVKNLSFRTIRKIMQYTIEDTKLPRTLFFDDELEQY